MSTQLNIFILLFGAVQGVLLSFFLVRKKAYLSAHIFLAAYIVVMVLQIVLKVMSKAWLMHNLASLYSVSYHLPLLYGPLVYLLTVHLLDVNKRISSTSLLHFAPFAIMALDVWIRIIPQKVIFLPFISIVIYHFLALYILNQDQRRLRSYFSNIQDMQLRWLRQFIISSFVVCLVIQIAIYLMFVRYPALQQARWGFLALTVFVYWVSFVAINHPEVFTVITDKKSEPTVGMGKLILLKPFKKYENSNLDEIEYKRIDDTLQQLIRTSKPQLDPDLTIEILAKTISCSRHHLSQVLNEHHHQSFYYFINRLRVEEAKRLLLSHTGDLPMKIAAVAFDSGFNSISSFNEVFKKITGQTPSQYRKQTRSAIQHT